LTLKEQDSLEEEKELYDLNLNMCRKDRVLLEDFMNLQLLEKIMTQKHYQTEREVLERAGWLEPLLLGVPIKHEKQENPGNVEKSRDFSFFRASMIQKI